MGNLIGNISWNGALVIYELEGTTLFHCVPGRNESIEEPCGQKAELALSVSCYDSAVLGSS